MKTVTVLKTFQNEGETVRPARGGQKPVRITVSPSRARELLKSGLVGDAEDAPEPTAEELEELMLRGMASASIDSSDTNIVTIRVRTSRQADALRGFLRETAERAKSHVADRNERGAIIDRDAGEDATSVLFADNRDRSGRDLGGEGGGDDDAGGAGEGGEGSGEGGEGGTDAAAGGSEGGDGGTASGGDQGGQEGGQGGEGGGGTAEPAAGGSADPAAGAVTTATAGAAAPPATRQRRGNRTGGAAS